MKCEICHQADAETVLVRPSSDGEEELYVCKACADSDRRRRRNKSMNMRRSKDEPHEENSEPESPFCSLRDILPVLEDLTNDMSRMIEDINRRRVKQGLPPIDPEHDCPDGAPVPDKAEVPIGFVPSAYSWVGKLHLEGLSLIGELEAVQRAMRAIDSDLESVNLDGVVQAGRLFVLRSALEPVAAERVVRALVTQENYARQRLQTEMPYVLMDSVCRSLALLKNCQLLAPGEYLDLLSPMRLAVQMELIDGLTVRKIDSFARRIDLSHDLLCATADEQDRLGCELARKVHDQFADVMLSEHAEDLLK